MVQITHPVVTRLAMGVVGVSVAAGVVVALGLTVLRGAPGLDRIRAFQRDPAVTPAATQQPFSVRVPGSVISGPAGDVLPALSSDAQEPSASVLARTLSPLVSAAALGSAVSVDVVDAASGQHLLQRSPGSARTPASTAKLVTGAAALSALGAQTTLPTTVVGSGANLTLVGGGDVLLGKGRSDPDAVDGHAGLTTLANGTATALKASGRTSIRLTLDDALFGSQRVAPGWASTDVSNGFVAPVMAAEINAGRIGTEDYAPRSSDPAMVVATEFVKALRAQGITVKGPITRGSAPSGATQLAQVRSASIAEQVEFALTQSDNTVAEALARLVAAKNHGALTFAGSGAAVLSQVRGLGVPVAGATLTDGSGLGRGSAIPAGALTGILRMAATGGGSQLRALLTGLPIAAVSGTLSDRFIDTSQKPARGIVRAKTGTLTGVSSLAGATVDADGRLLVFAVMADQVTSTAAARSALDDVATTLAQCGCH